MKNFNAKEKANLLLKKSERFLKTDTRYLIQSGSWVGIGLFVSSIVALFLAITFANLVDPQIYGTYKYIISIASILYVFSLPGMSTAINKSVAKGFEGSFIKALKLKMKWGLLGGAGALFLSLYYFIKGDPTLSIGLLVTAPFIPFIESFLLYNGFLGGKKLFKTQTKFLACISIFTASILITTIFFTDNVFILIVAYFSSYTFARLFFTLRTIHQQKPNNEEEDGTIGYGKHLSFISAIGTVAGNIDKLLVFHFVGATQLAIYTFALVPIIQLKFFNKIIKPLVMPKFAIRKKEELRVSFNRKILMLGSLLILIATLYCLVAPFFFKILFPKYLEAIGISQILSLLLVASVVVIPSSILNAHAKTKELYILQISEGVANIIVLTTMTALWGLIGLVWARVIVQFASLGLHTVIVKKYLQS